MPSSGEQQDNDDSDSDSEYDGDAAADSSSSSYPRCIGVGSGHTEGVGCVTMSGKQKTYDEGRAAVYSASGDKILKRWDLHSLLKKQQGAGDTSSTQGTKTASRAIQGVKGISLSVSSSVLQPPSAAMTCSHSVRAHDKDINCVVLAPNDALLATGSQDKLLKLWKADTLAPVATLKGHKRGKFSISHNF